MEVNLHLKMDSKNTVTLEEMVLSVQHVVSPVGNECRQEVHGSVLQKHTKGEESEMCTYK